MLNLEQLDIYLSCHSDCRMMVGRKDCSKCKLGKKGELGWQCTVSTANIVESHIEAIKWIKVKQDIIDKQNLLLYDYENMENRSIQKTTRIIPFFIHPFKGGCEECGETILNRNYNFCPWCGREISEEEAKRKARSEE